MVIADKAGSNFFDLLPVFQNEKIKLKLNFIIIKSNVYKRFLKNGRSLFLIFFVFLPFFP